MVGDPADSAAFADLEVIRMPLGDLTVSVGSARTLYLVKRDTVRLKDRADAALLKERFGLEDERCRSASSAASRK
jgi:hypothetical protein